MENPSIIIKRERAMKTYLDRSKERDRERSRETGRSKERDRVCQAISRTRGEAKATTTGCICAAETTTKANSSKGERELHNEVRVEVEKTRVQDIKDKRKSEIKEINK